MRSHKNLIIIYLTLLACSPMKNLEKPDVPGETSGSFFLTNEGCKLFVYDYQPIENYHSTIFVISGISGINHHVEMDVIEQLSNNKIRIVVMHPRGTGYSDGKSGDMANFSDFTNDYIELIMSDKDYYSKQHKILLFGHSMSTAVFLSVAAKLDHVDGAILVNPPYLLKKGIGMSPDYSEYVKYAWFYFFNRHQPIVNMAGDPIQIENEEDRKESLARNNDPLLVRYFSMHMMMESRKLMKSMIGYAKTANYPLLLIYGEKDNIVDKKGCTAIFLAWKCEQKKFESISNGSHGKSTVLLAIDDINRWIDEL